MLLAKNSDRDANEAQVPEWHARRSHAPGARVRCTWIEIPQVADTNAVLISRPFWMWGAEMGANDHGVAIGNEAVFTKEPYAESGLTGMDLVRLALERARTAAEAVGGRHRPARAARSGRRMWARRRSFTYHNSFAIADPEEAWILETAGRHWASERVVSGVRSISNGLTIPGFAEPHGDHLKTTVSQCRERLPDAALRDPGTASPAFEPERDEMERRWLSEPPTGVTAVAEGDELLERWVERVRTAVDRDLRAPWARHYWRVRDLSAALTEDRAPVALC